MLTGWYSAKKAGELILDLPTGPEISDLSGKNDQDIEINHEALPGNADWTEPGVESEE